MSQFFHPLTNVVTRWCPFALLVSFTGIIWVLAYFERSPYIADTAIAFNQPVPFSHKHHVGGLGLDCRYCHTSVETSAYAGMPPTKTCMTCHSQIWTNAPVLEPVRESWRTGEPIRWKRVNNLPDYVYFDHSAHIQKGIGCSSCHGEVDQMPLTMPTGSLEMQWCLTCHREPARFLRPRSQIFNMHYRFPDNQLALGKALARQYHILPPELMESCSLCHR